MAVRAADPLPSWNAGPHRQAILDFVSQVTREGSPEFVPPAERIAVFDNDGTLWAEQPLYFQMRFALDRLKVLAERNPSLKTQPPFKKLFDAGPNGQAAVTEPELLEIIMKSHAGMTTEEFSRTVKDWLANARHPRFNRPYTDCVYQPMRELLTFLRTHGFKTFIVSGGGVEFMRVFSEMVYGIPPEQVVGSSIRTKYEVRDGHPVLARLPEIDFLNDKAGKPVGIHKFVGRRPVAAFGNSDGDFQMLEWTTAAAGSGRRLGVLVRHDDAGREWAYDRQSQIGRLDRGLDEAPRRGWIVVSMKTDWNRVFPFD